MSSVSGLTEERFLKLRCALSRRIGSRRFSHTLGVEKCIIELGERYLPGDIPRLRVAALLHDLTKEWSAEEQVAYCREHGISLTAEEIAVPKILHAKTGAFLAEREFAPFVDEGILTAIRRHTTGEYGMTVFDELLYLADYIEPTRTYDECVSLRERFETGYRTSGDTLVHLHKTLLFALESTAKEIEGRGGKVFFNTWEAIRFFKETLALL